MKKLIAILLLGSLLILSLVGCNVPNSNNEVTTPESTTPDNIAESTTDDVILIDPPEVKYALSARVPLEWEIKNGDVSISLSFGLKKGCHPNDDSFSNIMLWYENVEGERHTFKTLDIEEIAQVEYVVEFVWDESGENIFVSNYAHTETIELPLSIFSGDSGIIKIIMQEWIDDSTEEGMFGAGTGVTLYYERNNTKILITETNPNT